MLPEMTLVERKTVEGQTDAALTLPANTMFTETWKLKNTGEALVLSGVTSDGVIIGARISWYQNAGVASHTCLPFRISWC